MGFALKATILTTFASIGTIGYLLYNAGLFSKINVFRGKIPKMTIAGIRFKGTDQIYIFLKKN